MINEPIYPVGIQDFANIRERNAVYVDKTDLIYRLTHTSKYVFLSRPRRFGKSLLSSTLQYYFEGRRDLFAGLAMDGLETEWTVNPVLHFDLSTAKQETVEKMEAVISLQLKAYEELYGRDKEEETIGSRLNGLIRRAYQRTGQKAVVLIDEYDAPILHVLHESTALRNDIRTNLSEFYSPLKACDPYLRFVFITGISTFSQLGIFSTLNNLDVISNSNSYATICGITHEELRTNFKYGLEKFGKEWNCGVDDVVELLRDNYDGYHFSPQSEGVFNPFSLLRAFKDTQIESYWFQTGTPTFLVEMLKKYAEEGKFDLSMLEEQRHVADTAFSTPIELMSGALPLLYQAGYLTIKGYDRRSKLYTLDIPNTEVRVGLMENLLPLYSSLDPSKMKSAASLASVYLSDGDYEGALKILQSLLSSIPFMRGDADILADVEKTEAYYHRLFYFFFRMLCNEVFGEVRNAIGACDTIVFTRKHIYVFEFKIDADPQVALDQIEEKGYAKPYLTDGRKIVKLGVCFSTKTRTIEDWKAVE
jgi:hypothetical protein